MKKPPHVICTWGGESRLSGPGTRMRLEAPSWLGTAILFQKKSDVIRRGAYAFLDAAHEFVFLSFGISQVVIRQFTVGLLKFAFDYIPIAFEMELS